MARATGDHRGAPTAMGGIVKAVEGGYPQREIARSAFELTRDALRASAELS